MREALWVREINSINPDGGSYQLSHVWDKLLTSETGSQSWWWRQLRGRNVDEN